MSNSLNCISMKQGTSSMGNIAKLLDRLNASNLIVNQHHADQQCFICDVSLKCLRRDITVTIRPHVGDWTSKALNCLACMEHSMMFKRRCNHSAIIIVLRYHTFDRPIIALCPSRGEENFLRKRTYTRGNGLPSLLYCFLGLSGK